MQFDAIENGRRDDPVTAPTRFLFVNGDVTSKSLSKIETPKLRPIINRHVQRWAFVTKGRKKRTTVQHAAKRRLCQKSEEPVPRAKASEAGALEKAKLAAIRPKALKNMNQHRSAAEEPKLESCIFPEGNNLDPFASTDIKIKDGVYRMVQYFTSTWKPFTCSCPVDTHFCLFPHEVEYSRSAKQSPDVHKIVQSCLNNKTHMYALSASCAGRMKYVSQSELSDIAQPESYMAEAIHALREHLINTPEVDQHVIRDIFFMYSCEYFSQNLDCAEKYLQMLKSMVERLGGFAHLDTYDRRLYWCGDMGLALEKGCPPILPTLGEPRVYHRYHFGDSSIMSIGMAFQRDDNGIASPLNEIISDMISCAQNVQCITVAQWTINKQRLFDHGSDFLHRLLSLQEPPANCSLKEQREECCRQGLILWLFSVMIWRGNVALRTGPLNPRLAIPLIAARLKRAIHHTDNFSASSWDSHLELLFWMVGQGARVAGPGGDQNWFRDRFKWLSGLLQISSIEQVSDLYRKHFYLEEIEKEDLTELMEWLDKQQATQTEVLWRDMSVTTSSSDSSLFSETSTVTSSNYATPSSESTP